MKAKVNQELEWARSYFYYDPFSGYIYRINLKQMKRKFFPIGTKNKLGYIQTWFKYRGKGKIVLAHRLAWFLYYGYWPKVIDHINMDKADNKISNLRNVTHHENGFNWTKKRKTTSSQYRGVSLCKRSKKWEAYVMVKYKKHCLGFFENEIDAAMEYNNFIKKLGVIASGNKI